MFSKLFRLDRTDPLSFGPKFPEILVEWIAPIKLKSLRGCLVSRFSPGTGRRLERKVKGPVKFVGGACLVVYS